MNKIIEVLLYPFTELAGWLVMRDLRRWARTPYLFDTTTNWELLHAQLQKWDELIEEARVANNRILQFIREFKEVKNDG